jgi:hypothetical protein
MGCHQPRRTECDLEVESKTPGNAECDGKPSGGATPYHRKTVSLANDARPSESDGHRNNAMPGSE